jgi:lipopolysaccharide exporter
VPLSLANLLSWVVMGMPNIVIGSMLGSVALGLFVLAFNVSGWPMSAIGTAIRAVALPGFAQLGSSGRAARTFNSAAALAWAGALYAGVMLSSLALALVPFLYGEKWLPAAYALVGLGFFGAFRIVTDLMATFLIAAGSSTLVLMVQILWLVTLVPALVIGVRLDGIAGASWGLTLSTGVVVLPAYGVMLHRLGVQTATFARNLLVPLLGAVPAGVCGMFVAHVVHQRLLALLIGGVLGTALYLLPIARWLRRRLSELRQPAEPATESDERRDGATALITSNATPLVGS